MADFRDEAHLSSWDHYVFVRTFPTYLDQRWEMIVYERKQSGGNDGGEIQKWRSMSNNRAYEYDNCESRGGNGIFGKMDHLQRLLDRLLSCRPMGLEKNNMMLLVAMYPIVRESFKLFDDICEVLAVLLDQY
ncbi:hypothetical protein POM88_013814 [Heracleum sosnowskyi]|uniref:AP180 N-terminal homology (ANTH) domain-containing protein n=1 Tax=Heracleum sosnowskyi TaxID=360622 RepID=A0AAD8N4S0_9APIA|nr:hypothetical protein POM88_013814 [Heracleum sosnowskyi]